MIYKAYYQTVGVARDASTEDIKKAYRKLARKYHPDVSKDPQGEAKFKEVAEAYEALKDDERRAAYDQLGRHQANQDFSPPPDWAQRFGDGASFGDNIDLSDLFAGLRGQRRGRGNGAGYAMAGEDFEVAAAISLEDAYHGAQLDLNLSMPERDGHGRLRHVPRTFQVRVPKGATDGQRLRLAGKGGKGTNGGADGDLYLNITLKPHPLYRVSGHDLYIDLPVTPWEAGLGATVKVPTLGGAVSLKLPAGTASGQKLRLGKRGLPQPRGGEGDLYAVVTIVMPPVLSDSEQALLKQWAGSSTFDPRAHF